MDKNRGHIRPKGWCIPGFALVMFVGLYAFLTAAHPLTWRGGAMGAPGALVISAYVLVIGRVLRRQFQVTDGVLVQILAIFLLGHFLPFMMDDVGNDHLFYAEKTENLFFFTLPALLNFMLCGIIMTQEERILRIWEKGFWVLALVVALFLNPFQGVILICLFMARYLFPLAEGVVENIRKKRSLISWQMLKKNGKQLLWIPVWMVAVVLALMGQEKQFPGIMTALRTMRSAMLNMTPIFHGGVLIINLMAVVLGIYRWGKHRETAFFRWLLEIFFCMGMTMVLLALMAAVIGDRYLVRPEVLLTWMGWLLIMTVSSLAYVLKIIPKAAYFLPILVYLEFCEVFLHFTAFADFSVAARLG